MSQQDLPESLLAHALATISEGSLITDADQNTIYANAAFTAITGYTQEEMLGRNCRMLQGPGTDPETVTRLRRTVAAGEVFRGHLLNYRKHGTAFWNDVTISPLRDAAGRITHFVSVQRDITTQVALQNELRFQAQHDALTGLPNRFALEKHLPNGLARVNHGNKVVAVGVIDLDNFKTVNDSFGHEAGDHLLQELARRLQVQLRESDLLARLGGDEFVVLIENLNELHPIQQLHAILNRLHKAVETPFDVGTGQTVNIGMSMGLALFPLDGVEGDVLLRQADAALYQAKAHKHDRARWWRMGAAPRDDAGDELDDAAYERKDYSFQLKSTAFRHHLFGNGLAMYMQPVVNLRSGAVHHLEALARLKMPDGAIVPPSVFLPLLNQAELNLLFRMGLEQTLAWLGIWDAERPEMEISVNLPPSTLLAPDCPRWVKEALDKHGIAPRRLSLELLETDDIEIDGGPHIAAIGQLMSLGVKLVMDDLGSGYSSLKRLSSLPFDVVKIDHGIMARLRGTPVQILSLISSLIQIGLDFKQSVVVEGLEDAGMIEAVTFLGAPFGQGNALAPPMPAEDLADWLQHFNPPRPPAAILTYLGALTYHLQFMHMNAGHPATLDACPLTTFLAARGLTNSDAGRWHAHIHSNGVNSQGAGRMLADWLVKQIQAEGGGS
jgi:diguanylate cyclase (GGDEF)-like protein/PAS domain S-box-containing protein